MQTQTMQLPIATVDGLVSVELQCQRLREANKWLRQRISFLEQELRKQKK